MKLLLKSTKIYDQNSPFHLKRKDIFIENGIIKAIDDKIFVENSTEIVSENLCVSNGWIDIRVHLREPGFEHVESIQELTEQAIKGGFTSIGLLPNTSPVTQTKESIKAIKYFSESQIIDLLPYAAVSKNCEGIDFTDMLDLHYAGAVAFTDGTKPLYQADFIAKTLLYLSQIDGLLMNIPNEKSMSAYGLMNESYTSNLLGMKGLPKITELMGIERDLNILEYLAENGTKVKYHFSLISTQKSVDLIKKAKTKGLAITCDVAIHNLIFEDTILENFDTNYKVNPPFRANEDIKALIEGLKDGTIDAVVSDHYAHDQENKKLEFDLAEFGIIGLETLFGNLNSLTQKIDLETIINLLTQNPAKILKKTINKIDINQTANLTFFDPTIVWNYQIDKTRKHINNSPFIDKPLIGKVLGIINKNKFNVSN